MLSLNLALVIHHFTHKPSLAIYRTEDSERTWIQFPSKTFADWFSCVTSVETHCWQVKMCSTIAKMYQ